MKNLIIFLFGVAVGAGGTVLWLHKDIRKELDQIKKDSEVPFSVDENTDKKEETIKEEEKPIAVKKETRVNYNNIINNNYSQPAPVPVMPRDDEDEDPENGFVTHDETDGGIFEIDREMFDNDESNEKERLIYFRGDRIMCTENGTIIVKPYALIGGEWESCVGNYAKNTAFIRNSRLVTDYEIYVENGLYEDEYGPFDGSRED